MVMVHKRTERWQRYVLLAVTVLCVGAIVVVALRAYRTPTPQMLQLADGTQIYYLSDTRIEPSSKLMSSSCAPFRAGKMRGIGKLGSAAAR